MKTPVNPLSPSDSAELELGGRAPPSSDALSAAALNNSMTYAERRATTCLTFLFGSRMLGLFLILPVFALHAKGMPGGQDATLVGLAMGIYGLTQGMLQIPFGMASDRFGRRKVIVIGLLIFALGSVVAALADSLLGVTAGRAIQGAGAISAAVTALLADSTRDSQRTKAMAAIGSMIGLMFAVSLVGAPLLYQWIGMPGLFYLMAGLALVGIAIVFQVPEAGAQAALASTDGLPRSMSSDLLATLRDLDLMRLNFGIFVLHAVQMAMFIVVPLWLVDLGGLSLPNHWKVYLPVVLGSFVFMAPIVMYAERRGMMKLAFVGSIALIALVEAGLAFQPDGLMQMALLLLLFFIGFNVLEASLPSLVSKLAPPQAKGAALGVYNTVQALGLFVGAGMGGWLYQRVGGHAVFWVCAGAMALWCLVAMSQKRWKAVPLRVSA